jgi:hypothetical protein
MMKLIADYIRPRFHFGQIAQSSQNRGPGLLTKGVIFLHGNARPHTASVTSQQLTTFECEVLEQAYPLYSPDLSPCSFHVFGELKNLFMGQHFSSDDDILG